MRNRVGGASLLFLAVITVVLSGCGAAYHFEDMTGALEAAEPFVVRRVLVEDRRGDPAPGDSLAGLGGSANVYYLKEKRMAPGYYEIFDNYVRDRVAPVFSGPGDATMRVVLRRFIKYRLSSGVKTLPLIGLLAAGVADTHAAELVVEVELLDRRQSPVFFKRYEERVEIEMGGGKVGRKYTREVDGLISKVLDRWGREVTRDAPLYKRMVRK